ncbi:glutathione S-transferase family protein [Pseudomonas sp. GX19020]|uniref:glutathione S-transferase family protein n=1 Tax=Pseudomonas sp. GX19020 TaxID=2942277 RepID=UPI002019CA38|nr:glutathione S-transferase family protein [Pseudomonas sp. GX19020]MCL4068164.1 glutathione S-transferase family protein [Pseudomonas sp. GX19020]
MGQLINGKWTSGDVIKRAKDGQFHRQDSGFRSWITADGSAGPGGEPGFAAEAGRYHLYVSLACPWAHRTLITRRLKGLEDLISVSVVNWLMADQGWTFAPAPCVAGDLLHDTKFLHEIYTRAEPRYTGKVTVPVLWDKTRNTIVSNESAEIIRMFNSAFDAVGANGRDFYPVALRGEIDTINDRVYRDLNNGVYRAGFAGSQAAYVEAAEAVFETLDWLEGRLTINRWLTGDSLTEADIRLFTTLIRFDAVYHGHFKCNLRRILDYEAISRFLSEFLAVPGVKETVNMEHIRRHYYESHRQLNPGGIVPIGPELPF